MDLKGRTIAITGASGIIGVDICRALLKRSAKVVGVVRNPDKAAFLANEGVEFRRADQADRPALEQAFAGCDAVVSNAALHRLTACNEAITSLLDKIPLNYRESDPPDRIQRSHHQPARQMCRARGGQSDHGPRCYSGRRGEVVQIILDQSEQLSGKRPVYRLVDDSELLLVIPAAEPPAAVE